MRVLTLEYDIEKKLKAFNLKEFFLGFVSGHISSYQTNFKNDLKTMLADVENVSDNIGQVKELDILEVKTLHSKANEISTLFDKLNDLYDGSNYFEDEELKQLFRSISRKLHKIENVSQGRLFDVSQEPAIPDYIKEGLAQFSKEAIANKLTSKH